MFTNKLNPPHTRAAIYTQMIFVNEELLFYITFCSVENGCNYYIGDNDKRIPVQYIAEITTNEIQHDFF